MELILGEFSICVYTLCTVYVCVCLCGIEKETKSAHQEL